MHFGAQLQQQGGGGAAHAGGAAGDSDTLARIVEKACPHLRKRVAGSLDRENMAGRERSKSGWKGRHFARISCETFARSSVSIS